MADFLAASMAEPERAFPTLPAPQLSRLAAHGRRRQTERGEVLIDAGDRGVPVFVVVSGELHAVRLTGGGETPLAHARARRYGEMVRILEAAGGR